MMHKMEKVVQQRNEMMNLALSQIFKEMLMCVALGQRCVSGSKQAQLTLLFPPKATKQILMSSSRFHEK